MRGQPVTLNTLHDVNPAGILSGGSTLRWDPTNKIWIVVAEGPGGGLFWTHNRFVAAATPLTTYTLTYVPFGINALAKNGLVLAEGTDYTVNATTGVVTLSSTPTTGDVIFVSYVTTGANPSGAAGPDGFSGVSFQQNANGVSYRIWSWDAGSPTQQAFVSNGGGLPVSGLFTLSKSGDVYTGTVAGVDVITWTDSGGIAPWSTSVGIMLGPMGSSTIDNFTATGASFTDDFNRADGDIGNSWTPSTPAPQISSNAIINTDLAGADARWAFRELLAVPTAVTWTMSGATSASGGYCHIACGVGGFIVS